MIKNENAGDPMACYFKILSVGKHCCSNCLPIDIEYSIVVVVIIVIFN